MKTIRFLWMAAIPLAALACDNFNWSNPWSSAPTGGTVPANSTGESYTILLCPPYEGIDHVAQAADAKHKTESVTKWSGVYVVHEDRISSLYLGRYASVKEAGADMEKVRAWKSPDGTRPFAVAMVAKRAGPRVGPPEWDLAGASDPNAYTVVIAEFHNVPEEGYITRKELAVDNCRDLRAKRLEAYYFHGPDISFVTIGMFPPDSFRMETTPDGGRRAVIQSEAMQKVLTDNPFLAVNGYKEKVTSFNPVTRKSESGYTTTYVQRISDYLSSQGAPRPLVVATRNPGKIREIREVLGGLSVELAALDGWPNLPEPAEDGATFAENARHKALYYARATGQWCLADDSGLAVDALGGEPGVRSARYAEEDCPPGAGRAAIDAANNAKLLAALADVPPDRRTARFICHVVLAHPQGAMLEACDAVEGVIGLEPRGENGFGYDPLFYLPQLGCTTAELDSDRKNALSHRGKALRKLERMMKEAAGEGRTSDLKSEI